MYSSTRIIKLISVAVLFVLSTSAVNAGGMTTKGTISKIYVHAQWTMVVVTGVASNPDACESTNFYALNGEDEGYAALHATLLAAQLASKTVYFWVSGCGGQNDSYPHIHSVLMET
jgi:hypothetical protein